MILNELFNSKTDYVFKLNGIDLVADFKIYHETYRVIIDGRKVKSKSNEEDIFADIRFFIKQEDDNDKETDGETGITGDGNEFTVFSTVLAIISEYIQKVNPYSIAFTAEEDSRIKLYKRMGNILSRKGWRDESHGSDFRFFRPEK